MFGSVYLELILGLCLFGLAVGSWILLMRASRRPVPPLILRSNFGAEVTTISEVALVAFGLAAIIDFLSKVTG